MGTLQENQSLNLEYERNKELRELKEEREIIKKVSFLDDRYFVSNMGRIFSNKAGKSNDEFVELTTQNNKENKKEFITLVKKDGSQSTYRLDGLVYRTFTGDTSQRLRLIHIDGDMLNNKLSNLKKAKEDKNDSKAWVFPEEELKKFNKEDLIDLLKRMCIGGFGNDKGNKSLLKYSEEEIAKMIIENNNVNDNVRLANSLLRAIRNQDNIINKYEKMSFVHEIDLQNRINKTIEYIEENSDDMHAYISHAITQILKGSDKE